MKNAFEKKTWHARSLTLIEIVSYSFTAFYWLSFCVARRQGIPIIDISSYTLYPAVVGPTVIAIGSASAFFSLRIIASLKHDSDNRTKLLEILLPIALLAVALVTGGRFDYASYKLQWALINEGLNPWGPVQGGMVNAYGPVHNLLSYPYAIWHLLPKIIFCALVILTYQICKRRWSRKMSTQSLLMICYGPFILSGIGVYGFMDIVPAGLIFIAAAYFSSRRFKETGISLAIAAATKFYPALLVAPVCAGLIGRKRNREWIALLCSFGLTLAITFGWAWLVWGESVLTPLNFASERGPSFLTIWRLLPEKWVGYAKMTIILAIGLLSIHAVIGRGKSEINIGHLLLSGLCFIFGLYYLGHQQFYIAIYLLLPVAFMECAEGRTRNVSLSIFTSFLLLFWLTFTQTSFDLFSEYKPSVLMSLVDWMSVINSLLLFICGFLYASQSFDRMIFRDGSQSTHETRDYAI